MKSENKIMNIKTVTVDLTRITEKDEKWFKCDNEIIDIMMRHLSPTEFKVYMLILRKIIGWDNKEYDEIAMSQIMKFTGLSMNTAKKAIEGLININLIKMVASHTTTKGKVFALCKGKVYFDIEIQENDLDSRVSKFDSQDTNRVSKFDSPECQQLTLQKTLKDIPKQSLTKDSEIKISYSDNYLKDIEVIRDNTTKRMKVIDKLYIKYCKAVKLFGQDHVSNAILGYACDDFFKKDSVAAGKWNFEKLLNNETNLDMFALKGEKIKPKINFPSDSEIKADPKSMAFKIRTDFTYVEIKNNLPEVFEQWKDKSFFTGIFEKLIIDHIGKLNE